MEGTLHTTTTTETEWRGWRGWLAGAALALALALALERLVGFAAVDWRFYQDILAQPLRAYEYDYFNPPWALWLLAPLARLPYSTGWVRLLTLLTFVTVARKRGADGAGLILLATSAPLLFLVANANIDFLPALAFLLAPAWGLPLLLIKPQTGVFAALAWLRRAGRDWRGLARLLAPTLALFAASLLVYGWWLDDALRNIRTMQSVGLPQVGWNTSVFPWGVPLGLYFAWRAWRQADEFHGVTATLLLSPYTPLYSMSLWYALFVGRARRWAAALVWVCFWLIYVWHYGGVGAFLLRTWGLG